MSMQGSVPRLSGGRGWLKYLLLVLTVWCGGMAAGAFCVYLYHEDGRARRISRLSTLMVLRHYLRTYAEAHGRYPERIEDAVDAEDLPHFGIERLEYSAAGKSYPLNPTAWVFHEIESTRYGFEVGRFFFTEQNWKFLWGDEKQL